LDIEKLKDEFIRCSKYDLAKKEIMFFLLKAIKNQYFNN